MKLSVRESAPAAAHTEQPPSATHAFGFFIESYAGLVGEEPVTRDPHQRRKLAWIECPESEICHLSIEPGAGPRITGDPPPADRPALALEPIRHEGHAWLVFQSRGEGIRVNGFAAPPMGALGEADQVELDEEHLLHAAMRVTPFLGPASERYVGSKCGYCKSPIRAEQVIYVCPYCDAAMHNQGDEVPEDTRLACATMASACRQCGMAIVTKEEVSYVPE
jgi:hypothetical protein